MSDQVLIRSFDEIKIGDIPLVGGKNASLGEMIHNLQTLDINVPQGFAVTTEAFWLFWKENDLDIPISHLLHLLKDHEISLNKAGKEIRKLILGSKMPVALVSQIEAAYMDLCSTTAIEHVTVAARSSATAEDLPEASFAGQHESYLNISGVEEVLEACQKCFASLYTDRAITYRNLNNIDHSKVALSVGIQLMVRSDQASSGVMFSIDTETGFQNAVIINAAWGLGEGIVLGTVDPDEYMVFKPFLNDESLTPIMQKRIGSKQLKVIYDLSNKAGTEIVATSSNEQTSIVLSDEEILILARSAQAIEEHYGIAMDMEWAKDHNTGRLYILQARPETVHKKKSEEGIFSYKLNETSNIITQGLSIGDAIATGEVYILSDISEVANFPEGAVLVTSKTDPDWLPIMQKASALVTDHGGRTSHAAIVSRELGLPAVIGASGATNLLKDGQSVTVSCAEGSKGFVYEGKLSFDKELISLENIPQTKTEIMLNIANPSTALRWARLPADGIGLARMEFIISNNIKIHPMALVDFDKVENKEERDIIEFITQAYPDKKTYFIEKLAEDISLIAASQFPKPVIVRLSDFKTNEYANLIGGSAFEPHEENPMIGWRGASRYYDEKYRAAFALECLALKKVRDIIGFTNVIVMVPFCRTIGEADAVLQEMAQNGLKQKENGLEIYVMAEIPSNIILAEEFAERFDGFSIGSNDLTQLTLGLDRDSDRLSELFKADDPAVIALIKSLIKQAHKKSVKVGLCGQAPSDDPNYARMLVEAKINSISVTPDSFISVKKKVAEAETTLK
tara:strand:- start:48 stop:2435 length:2388 start_codon:yes stop_codon:yes gene_type:complete